MTIVKYESLKDQIERFGFEVIEGNFTLPDGRVAPLLVRPIDPEALTYAAARAYADRAHQRRQKLLAKQERLDNPVVVINPEPHPG